VCWTGTWAQRTVMNATHHFSTKPGVRHRKHSTQYDDKEI
jgi:hypothetical protein